MTGLIDTTLLLYSLGIAICFSIIGYLYKGWHLNREMRLNRRVRFDDIRRRKLFFTLKVFFCFFLISYFYLLWKKPSVMPVEIVENAPEIPSPIVQAFEELDQTGFVPEIDEVIEEQLNGVHLVPETELIHDLPENLSELSENLSENLLSEQQNIGSLDEKVIRKKHHTPKYRRGLVPL